METVKERNIEPTKRQRPNLNGSSFCLVSGVVELLLLFEIEFHTDSLVFFNSFLSKLLLCLAVAVEILWGAHHERANDTHTKNNTSNKLGRHSERLTLRGCTRLHARSDVATDGSSKNNMHVPS